MGRNYFLRDPEEARDVGLQIYRGYATEVAQKMINGQFQFVILIDAASKPQRKNISSSNRHHIHSVVFVFCFCFCGVYSCKRMQKRLWILL
jgi:xylose isomerase